MRYRSATVAGFHGLPRCLGQWKRTADGDELPARFDRRQRPCLSVSCELLRGGCTCFDESRGKHHPHVGKTHEPTLAKNISLNLDMTIYRLAHEQFPS